MPQIFHRSANHLARISLVEQPIQFSHLHHAGDDGIDLTLSKFVDNIAASIDGMSVVLLRRT